MGSGRLAREIVDAAGDEVQAGKKKVRDIPDRRKPHETEPSPASVNDVRIPVHRTRTRSASTTLGGTIPMSDRRTEGAEDTGDPDGF